MPPRSSVGGLPERLAQAPATPLVVEAAENTYASIRVTWADLPAGTAYVRVRWRQTGETAWQTDCFGAAPGLLRWLTPGTAYEVSAEAVGAGPELGARRRRQVTLPQPLARRTRADFVQQFRAPWAAARRFSPRLLLAGPGLGTERVGPGSDYLGELYAAGLREAVDVVDVHPYPKRATPTPPGGILGGPESVLANLAACRERLRQAGDSQRAVIATECGHPTYAGDWHMPPSSDAQQAQWTVRTHLLLAAAGLERVYWYAFQDEGTNRAEPEHGAPMGWRPTAGGGGAGGQCRRGGPAGGRRPGHSPGRHPLLGYHLSLCARGRPLAGGGVPPGAVLCRVVGALSPPTGTGANPGRRGISAWRPQ